MRTIKSMAALAAALFICLGGATAQAQTSGKSVCVISALGHRFEMQKIGLMVFGNSLEGVDVNSWGIDEAAARKAGQVLGKRFAVRRIPVSKAALTKLESRSAGFFQDTYGDFLRTAAAGAGKCDFYLTLTRAVTQVGYPSNQAFAGLGILSMGAPINERFYVFASYFLRLHDGNFANLKGVSPRPDFTLSIMYSPGTMHRQVDASWWPASAQAAVQSTRLKNTIRTLVEDGLARELPGLFP